MVLLRVSGWALDHQFSIDNMFSFTGMFNGIRKIVSSIGSAENLDETVHDETEILAIPCLTKTKKRKALDTSSVAFSAKKK